MSERWGWHDASEGHRLHTLEVVGSSSSKLLDLEYTYDVGAKIDEIVDHRFGTGAARSSGVEYSYDGLGRLSTADYAAGSSDAFTHSSIGNVASRGGLPMVYDPVRPHQIRSWAGQTYMHNAHGAMESRSLFVGGNPQQFDYDPFRRLSRIDRPAAGGGVESVSFGYDYADRRVSRVRDGNTEIFFHRYLEARDGLLVKYYFVGERLVASNRVVFAQASGSGGPFSLPPWAAAALAASCGLVVVLILWAPGRREVRIGVVVARSRAAGTTVLLILFPAVPVLMAPQCGGGTPTRHFYHVDHLGSTQLVTLPGGGVYEEIRYGAWGAVRGRWDGLGTPVAPSQESRFEWNGYETEHGWALEYAGARYYDSAIGQFLSHDPAGQYASPYAYGPGDPANGTDPSGASFLPFLGAVIKILLGGLSGSYTSGGGGADLGTNVSFGGGGPGEGAGGGRRANGDAARAPNGAIAPIDSRGQSTVVAVGSAIAGLANSGANTAGGAFAAGVDAASMASGVSQGQDRLTTADAEYLREWTRQVPGIRDIPSNVGITIRDTFAGTKLEGAAGAYDRQTDTILLAQDKLFNMAQAAGILVHENEHRARPVASYFTRVQDAWYDLRGIDSDQPGTLHYEYFWSVGNRAEQIYRRQAFEGRVPLRFGIAPR